MNLNSETILDFYMYKNKKILCQIKVKSCKGLKYKNTCRSLTQEQWNTFDKELEKLVATTENWNNEQLHQFNINPYIEVKVKKSKLSLKQLSICLGTISDNDVMVEANYILECAFNFQYETVFNSSLDSQEYVPQIEVSPDGKLCSTLNYEPYTPSKKEYIPNNKAIKTSSLEFLEGSEDTYSPKPLFEIAETDSLVTETIPKYTPAPIKSSTSSLIDVMEPENDIKSSLKNNSSKLNRKIEIEYIPKSENFTPVDIPVYIPTPIEQQKLLNAHGNIRKHKKRSKTIDELPIHLVENPKEKYDSIQEQLKNMETPSSYAKKMLIKRSKTIDEIPAAFAVNFEKTNLNNITIEESRNKTINLKSKGNNLSNENIFISKEKVTQSDSKTKRGASSSPEDALLYEHKKFKKALLTNDDKLGDNYKMYKKIKLKEATINKSEQKVKDHNAKENTSNDFSSLRRSVRSPSKPRRFIEEQQNLLKKNKLEKQKISPKNRELFGTDDEDDEIGFEKNETKINDDNLKIKSSSVSVSGKCRKSASLPSNASIKKKRKRVKSVECEQEKRDINKWLSKKKYSSSGSRSKSPITKPAIELPSANELELLRNKTKLNQKENKVERIKIDKMCTSSSKEVCIL